MEILKNSIWDIKELEGFDSGLYRLLSMNAESNFVILFPVDRSKDEGRPVMTNFSNFQRAIAEQCILKATYTPPSYILAHDDEIDEKDRLRRDKNYQLIKSLVNDSHFLIAISNTKRTSGINKQADKVGVSSKTINRLLRLYWKYGQTSNALIAAYDNCGGYGKTKKLTDQPMGRPQKPKTAAFERSKNFILTEKDKDNFKNILSTHFMKAHGKSMPKVYGELLRTYYSDEIKIANALNSVPNVPSITQLRYWKDKLFDKAEVAIKTTTEKDYLLNRRGLDGSTTTKWSVPGDCFEIDATVADVHIVSEWSSNLLLGRPTIYFVVDRATGFVCGLNISLFHASWRAARQALANTFLPKADYCREFGIQIQDSDWPANHIPLTLMCDNGEMIGLNPQKLVVPLTELQLSPPYRPDFKAMVERKYGSLNDELIHDLSGTTRGGIVIRGDKDPRKDAIYTLKKFTSLIIDATLELNRRKYDRLARSNPLLIRYDLQPTPLNSWKVNLASYKHSLQVAEHEVVVSRMYPSDTATMTRHGVRYNGMYYSNGRVIRDGLSSVARTNGTWKVDVRINENTTNFIYVKFDKNGVFEKCNLISRSDMFKNKPMYEAEVFSDWEGENKIKSPISVESIESQKFRKEKEKEAIEKSSVEPVPFAKKVRDMRENRKEEIKSTSNAIDEQKSEHETSEPTEIGNKQKGKTVHLPRRPKGK